MVQNMPSNEVMQLVQQYVNWLAAFDKIDAQFTFGLEPKLKHYSARLRIQRNRTQLVVCIGRDVQTRRDAIDAAVFAAAFVRNVNDKVMKLKFRRWLIFRIAFGDRYDLESTAWPFKTWSPLDRQVAADFLEEHDPSGWQDLVELLRKDCETP